MPLQIQFQVSPEEAKNEAYLKNRLKNELKLDTYNFEYRWRKRSIDARKREVKINCTFEVFINEPVPQLDFDYHPKEVGNCKEVVIVGAGPAGYFSALRALERGLKPIIFERGKDVRSRRRDLAKLNKEGLINGESNYCFGEGGAGTYSDGKLYTRSKKRGDVEKALKWFVHFGADQDILVDAHPHIGTNKLPQIITSMREEIELRGGLVNFDSKVTDILIENGKVVGLQINENQNVNCDDIILATGHSARDIFELLYRKKIEIQAKPFALGVRVEHTQELIDTIQYSGRLNDDFLPPASYSLVTQVDGRGVFSFCMCPGGIIAPCATAEGEVVTNGWSPSKRNNPYSNSGVVVAIFPQDFPGREHDPFVCLDFQKEIEHKCWVIGGETQRVPAQRMIDFIEKKKSIDFPRSSYQPGIVSVDLNTIFPSFVAQRLRKAFVDFGSKMKGYLTNDAVLHAPESRTSSPIQIPRNESCEHPNVKGLYPCGEGAGYAGGIISAAIDGMKCLDAIADKLLSEG